MSRHCCGSKAVSVTFYDSVSVASVIQHAKRMRRIILPSVTCPSDPYYFFFALSHKLHDFRKNLLEINVSFCFLYKTV